MDVHNEVGTGLKASLLFFVLILVGTLVYFVIRQNEDIGTIYATSDDAVLRLDLQPKTVDTNELTP